MLRPPQWLSSVCGGYTGPIGWSDSCQLYNKDSNSLDMTKSSHEYNILTNYVDISIIKYITWMTYSIIMSNALYCYVLSLHVVSWIFKVSSSLIVLLSHMQLKAMRDWTAGRCSTGRPLTETKRQGSVILMMEEILHQLTVVYPIIWRVQNVFHQQYGFDIISVSSLLMYIGYHIVYWH